MSRAKTIQEVLEQLDLIIEDSINENSRLGLFAYVYRRTTAEIASEIDKGRFEDNPRMEKMDVAFANLYLDAYKAYKNDAHLSASWAFAFDHAKEPLTILQHIMLGMNAHINLDLGIATAATMTGKNITAIESDFNKVNDILFQITNELQERLGRVSPLMFLLDWFGQNKDEKVIDFSMRKAREQSWNSANLIWSIGPDQHTNTINAIDQVVLKIAERIQSPRTRTVRFLLKLMRNFETKQVNKIITKLKAN